MNQRIKQIIIVVIIITVSFVGYKMFFVSSEPAGSTLASDQGGVGQVVDGPAILALLNALNKVTLDDSVFSDKIFVSLINFEKPLEEQVIGRQNPFLPIGVDGSGIILPVATSTVVSVR